METRYKIIAFCDDLKPAITSNYEFLLVERVMTIFELSSGCKMHRTPGSTKCKFLPLGKWRNSLTQDMVPFDFFTLSDSFLLECNGIVEGVIASTGGGVVESLGRVLDAVDVICINAPTLIGMTLREFAQGRLPLPPSTDLVSTSVFAY